ncbi:hypothetical protein NWQ34_05255 [Mycoplasmopsis felis]|uniref:hypothetical protein n=1 Tax=Mycoplasmopsis felis TaxID=33923 RepID=UPI0021DFFC24|nr:hypothetical protein [Mycoplasmopsis felis]MCU9938977.1 hypothetical protein [Mycoplasmopsis felis]
MMHLQLIHLHSFILENKKIKELSLYTEGNSLLEYWSLNPLALRNTNWVNTIDYNVSKENPANTNIPTRITFNALAFEDSDYLKGEEDPYKRINDGLRLDIFLVIMKEFSRVIVVQV